MKTFSRAARALDLREHGIERRPARADEVGALGLADEQAAFGVGVGVPAWMRTPSKFGTLSSSGSGRRKRCEKLTTTS